MLGWLRARLSGVSNRHVAGISIVSDWLANKLWNIEAKFYALASQGYGQNEVLYACLRLISQSIPEPPLIAYEMGENGSTKTPLPYKHKLVSLIRNPNELMTEYEFWELTTLHVSIVGRSCWWKERNNLGEVIALWPMRPDRVGPIYSDSQAPGRKVLAGWSYQNPGTGEFNAIDRSDVLTFNLPDPVGESGGIVEGFGPVQVLAKQIASDNEATKFVGALLANYAAPTIVLKVKAPVRDENEAKLIKAKFRHEFGGANRGTPALLDAESEIQPIGFDLQQLEFPELRSTSESRIAAALGVPAILVGLKVGLQMGNNRASVTEQRAFFAETTLSGHWRRFQDQYTSDIAKDFGDNIVCEFDLFKVRAMSTHFQQRLAPIVDAFKNMVITIDEYRGQLNLPLLGPGRGDMLVMTGNARMVPVSDNMGEAIAVTGRTEAPSSSVGDAVPTDTVKPTAKKSVVGDIKTSAEDKDDAFQWILEEALEAEIVPVFDKFWSDAVNDIKSDNDFPEEEFIVIMAALFERELTTIFTQQFVRSIDSVTIGLDIAEINALASEWSRTYSYNLVNGLTSTTKAVIQEAMRKYHADPSMSIDKLKNLLSAAFDPIRAEMIAMTEVTRARNMATMIYQEQLDKMGVKTSRVWITRRDERVCPICGPLHGTNESAWKGAHPLGPPIHVRCRCGLALEKST